MYCTRTTRSTYFVLYAGECKLKIVILHENVCKKKKNNDNNER